MWLGFLRTGFTCKSSAVQDPDFVQIGNPDLIAKRAHRRVPGPHGGTLDDYVPFYFTPFSPMLLNIKTGWNGMQKRSMHEIVLLTSTLHTLATDAVPFIFSDRHAYLQLARFSDTLDDLGGWVDWKILGARDFARDPNDPGKFERYQAEALIYKHVPVAALNGIVCHGTDQEAFLRDVMQNTQVQLPVASRPGWFF